MLSGNEILRLIKEGSIVIEPFDEKNLGANSYYVHMGDELMIYDCDVLDCKKKSDFKKIKIPEEGYVLRPNELYLARTQEYTEFNNVVPILNGRLSLALLGIAIHITAGFGDNGFTGTWTLEIFCVKPVRIYPNMKVGQFSIFPLIGDNELKYRGKYYGQKDIRESHIYEEFAKEEEKC